MLFFGMLHLADEVPTRIVVVGFVQAYGILFDICATLVQAFAVGGSFGDKRPRPICGGLLEELESVGRRGPGIGGRSHIDLPVGMLVDIVTRAVVDDVAVALLAVDRHHSPHRQRTGDIQRIEPHAVAAIRGGTTRDKVTGLVAVALYIAFVVADEL